ncbi:2689_t:CDS:1, partial [Acaulospora colombiana]
SFRFSFNLRRLSDDHPLNTLRSQRYLKDFIAPFSDLSPVLDGIMLYHAYVEVSLTTRSLSLKFCTDCETALSSSKIPKFSLRNDLYRGRLPDDLQDITWIEEKVCALHRVYADVARLFNGSKGDTVPYRLVGNTCAYPANVASTALRLPRTPADVNGNLTVVFVGTVYNSNKLPRMFRVRRRVIQRFLNFLAENNPLYADVPICYDTLNQYPEDGLLPSLAESVIFTPVPEDSPILAEETASFDDHPAIVACKHAEADTSSETIQKTSSDGSNSNDDSIIESTGIVDFDGTSYSGHAATATALSNLVNSTGQAEPDLVLKRGTEYVKEYDNPSLLPGMFPTLFPYGGAGLEEIRPIPISFQEHSNYLLSLYHPAFKHHRLFMFVVLNIIKRRRAHLFTSFTVNKPGFSKVAKDMASVSSATLESTAKHLRDNGSIATLTPEQRKAYDCLKQLNIVTGHIPGSPAAKLVDRSSMFAYFGLFGTPHIFLTMNYPTLDSPIFHVMVGDEKLDLSSRFPKLPFPTEKAKRLADNPVAAADFFVFSMRMFFKHLLGYDMETGESKGGIFGHILAHYGKAECTGRGNLHGHHILWLLGGLNPSDAHSKLENNPEFQSRFFAFWEQIIKHDVPLQNVEVSPSFNPRSERPPPVRSEEWFTGLDQDVSSCAE